MDDLIERLKAAEGHTPGPWGVSKAGSVLDDEWYADISTVSESAIGSWAGFASAVIRFDDGEPSWIGKRNAALIALAPEMKARIFADADRIAALTAERDEARSRAAVLEAALQGAANDALRERHNRGPAPNAYERGAVASSVNIEESIRARIAALAAPQGDSAGTEG